MALESTNTFINFHDCVITPASGVGTAVHLDRITDFKPNNDGVDEMFKGDANRFPAVIAVPTQERTFEIDTGDVATAAGIPQGAVYGVSIDLDDAVNGAAVGGGGLTWDYVNAVLVDNTANGPHAKFASATLKFRCFANTGDTDPLTIAAIGGMVAAKAEKAAAAKKAAEEKEHARKQAHGHAHGHTHAAAK